MTTAMVVLGCDDVFVIVQYQTHKQEKKGGSRRMLESFGLDRGTTKGDNHPWL